MVMFHLYTLLNCCRLQLPETGHKRLTAVVFKTVGYYFFFFNNNVDVFVVLLWYSSAVDVLSKKKKIKREQ